MAGAMFHVFVEGPVDDGPLALPELAEAMSKRYGIAAGELVSRLKRGRFRVKSNVDGATAGKYKLDLEGIGARVVIEDASLSPPTNTPVAGVPAVVRPSQPSLPPVNQTIMGGQIERAPASSSSPPPFGKPSSNPGLPNTGLRAPAQPAPRAPTPAPVAAPAARPTPVPTTPPVTGLAAAGPQHARAATPSTGPQHQRAATPAPAPGHGGFGGHGGHGGQAGTTPPSNRPSAPPSALAGYARPSTPPPIANTHMGGPAHQRPSTPIPTDMVSGLSAGFGDAAQVDLGAFAQSNFSLASLDGEEAAPAANQFDAPPEPPPEEEKPVVTMKAAKPKAEAAPKKTAPPANKPMDLFAPPDAGDQDLAVDLATEEIEEIAARKTPSPTVRPATQPVPSSSSSLPSMRRASTPIPVAGGEPVYGTSVVGERFSRGNFVLGIVIALAVGFVPAHFIANMREKSAFAEIDRQVAAMDAAADSQETYAALDAARDKMLDEKQSARTMIALTSMGIWAIVAVGVAFAFFRANAAKSKKQQPQNA